MNPRILVLEDDQALCKIYSIVLRKMGFAPDFAPCGEDAIALYTQANTSAAPYAAVILDLFVVHGMGGLETCEKLRAISPQVYTIVASGSSKETLSSEYQEKGFTDFLAKPFRVQDLEECLTRMKTRLAQAGT